MKSVFKTFSFLLILLFLTEINSFAATEVQYQTPVRVEVLNKNATIYPNGAYTLSKLSTNEIIYIKPNTALSFTNANKNVSFGAFNLSSTDGFKLSELTGVTKLVTFSATTPARREASPTGTIRTTYYNGESAEYISTVGEWYIIKAKNGENLAVQKSSNVVLYDVPAASTFRISQLTSGTNPKDTFRGSVNLQTDGKVVNVLDIEYYVKGVLPNEMPASWHAEALKTQAVSARSYAYVKNKRSILSSTTSSQVYGGFKSEDSRSNAAVDATAGKYVKYNNAVIETFFSSTSGGRTANVGDVWNSNQSSFPYLVSVEDKFENSPNSNWENPFSSRTLLNKFGFGSTTLLYNISASKTGANGEVSAITLSTSAGDKTISGNEMTIRKLFPIEGSYGMLKSNWFDLVTSKTYTVQATNSSTSQFGVLGQTVQLASGTTTIGSSTVQIQNGTSVITQSSDPTTIVAKGKGWGHRIGMSQYGAKGYAENGWTYDNILKHYFQGTTIGTLN